MSTRNTATLGLERGDDGRLRLVSPGVGVVTAVPEAGAALAPGQPAGVLVQLGREVTLLVPENARGVVVSARPERVRAPLGFGDVVLELDPSGVAADVAALGGHAAGASAGPVVKADQSGRFYRRTAPGEPPLADVGTVLTPGTPLGLLEVMKTFSHVTYRAAGGLPPRARVVRALAEDGADVEPGTPLFEVEPC